VRLGRYEPIRKPKRARTTANIQAARMLEQLGTSLPALLGLRMSSRGFGTYGPRKYITASIPMTTSATKIRAPATTLSPVSK
jgi:hypothetical protein